MSNGWRAGRSRFNAAARASRTLRAESTALAATVLAPNQPPNQPSNQPSRIHLARRKSRIMLWVKSFHILFVITWFAGLFYLPRLFVYHAQAGDRIGIARFKVMERKLFWGIMTPSAALALFFGAWLWRGYGFGGNWLALKLPLVALVLAYHFWCYLKLRDFRHDRNRHGHLYYRLLNEAPVLLAAAIIILTVVKPV